MNQLPSPPAPVPRPPQETYSVVVTDVPVKDVLFALARDAGVNVDVSGELQGNVTINAIDQTLPQILTASAARPASATRWKTAPWWCSPTRPTGRTTGWTT